MKTFLSSQIVYLVICSVLASSCSQTVIESGPHKLRLNNFAGHMKADGINIGGPDGIRIKGWDDDATKVADAATKEVGKAFRSYLLAEGIKYFYGKYYDNKSAELSAKSTENLEKLRNAKSAADQKHALEVLKATPPEPVAGALAVPAA